MNAINNITIGHPERLRKPVGYTMLANLVNIFPFMLSIEAAFSFKKADCRCQKCTEADCVFFVRNLPADQCCR